MNIMDNFSVVASLMLFGLFLIASPSEGYVVGYIDLSDQRLQSSMLKKQGEPIMSNKTPYKLEDGALIFASKDNNEPPLMKPEYPIHEYDPSLHDISSNHVAAENQNGETSQSNNEIIYSSDDRRADEERSEKEDVELAGTPPNKENGNDSNKLNRVIYIQTTSRL